MAETKNAPVERVLIALVILWLGAGTWGYFTSDPAGACYTGPGDFISRMRQAYGRFSVPSEIAHYTDGESAKELYHKFHFAEQLTSLLLGKVHAEEGHGIWMLAGAAALAFPAGVILRYIVSTPPCPEERYQPCPPRSRNPFSGSMLCR
jgi:hypothetical protein